ncbi:MAG: HNH endonuclease, partial [Micrococcales bacterium]|nr:HNH endonuclease [Micrococcales bacterium]
MTTTVQENQLRPVVGVDGGDNSAGLASILVDQGGHPIAIHAMLSTLHDGGKDGMASNKDNKVSRKASGGTARRARRLLRTRRRRAADLDRLLDDLEYPITDPDELDTFAEWEARIDLLAGYIADDDERRRLISIAIRHMSNHRGWANAWVSLEVYWRQDEMSPELVRAAQAAAESGRFGPLDPGTIHFQADLAALGMKQTERLRPLRPSDKNQKLRAERRGPGDLPPVTTEHLLGIQQRVDVIREWRRICEIQQLDDSVFESLSRVAFSQEKPYVPAENVGKDWLPGMTNQDRASIASLEHQEFQIRQVVANLRVRNSQGRQRLTPDDQNLIVDTLMSVTKKTEALFWSDIAESILGNDAATLVTADPEHNLGATAPIMRSHCVMLALPKAHPIRKWWLDATPIEQSAFILWYADPIKTKEANRHDLVFSRLFDALTDSELQTMIEKAKFPSGRAAHCLESLRRMNEEMRLTGDTYVEVRNRIFGDGEDLRPSAGSLDTTADHPTLQRILPPVRRFLMAVEREHGTPQRVVIEHVRNAFLGLAAKQEAARVQGRNRRDRERAIEHIRDAYGITEPTDHEIRRVQAYERQGAMCLYCGDAPGLTGMQMDHIVPRANGGNSTRANLAAVCLACNAAKGKEPFAVFAASGRRPGASLDDAIQRVDAMLGGDLDRQLFGRMKAEMKRRLRQTKLDDPIDERSLASTAYAATDMRDRIMGSLGLGPGDVTVYPGRIVQAARRASGIDKRILLREGITAKSRFDRRHHAIDAAVAAMLNPSVARTLAEREDARRAALDTGSVDSSWKQYEGSSPQAIEKYRVWKEDMARLAELIASPNAKDRISVTQPNRPSPPPR